MCRRAIFAALVALAIVAPSAAAQTGDQTVFALTKGCFGLRAVDGGRFVVKDAGGGYRAAADVVGAAEPFRMQATTLKQYMLYGRDRDFLAAGDGGAVETIGQPGPTADWRVEATDGALRLTLAGTGKALALGDGGKLVTTGGSGSRFTFEPAAGCPEYPHADPGVTGEPMRGTSPFGEVRGTIDAHMHMMAFEFLGGRAHCGKPWSPYGITVALVDCPDHYPNGAGAFLENAISEKGQPLTHDPSGWPDFKGWPTYGSLTHEQSYYEWVERAWRGGLRVFVNLLVENKVLCEVYPYKQNSCDEMDAVRLQAKDIHALQDYVDAQEGGPGKGWFRIVTDPAQARRVVNDGKLAVVLGIEVSEPFGCQVYNDVPQCDRKDIADGLDEVYRLGVRDMELVNKFDNALGGVAGDNGTTGAIVNNGNKIETGKYWAMETCTGPPDEADREQPEQVPVGHNHDDLIAAGLKTFASSGVAPVYGPAPHCNQRGLTDLGAFMVERMMDKRMVIDPDHLSVVARKQLLPLVEARGYSGIVSSHSWSTIDAFPRIYRLGGVVTPYAGDSTSFVAAWKKIRPLQDPRFYSGLGYGADMNGFGKQGHPRGADAVNPVTYPFRSSIDPGVTVQQMQTGTRRWDINTDGVAQYGLYPDWVEDLRHLAGDQITQDLARGAESYLQMWERADGVPVRRCMPLRSRLTRRGLEDVQVGRTADQVLRAAGQPDRRPGRVFEFCAQVTPAKQGVVRAVLTDRGRVGLVASQNRNHKAGGIGRGDRARRLRGKARRFGRSGVLVRRLKGGHRFVYGVRKGRVTWTAVASAEVAAHAPELRRELRLAGLR